MTIDNIYRSSKITNTPSHTVILKNETLMFNITETFVVKANSL